MSQEELEKLLLEAHISQDFDLKTLESQWFQTFCKVRKNGCPFLIFGCVSLILFGVLIYVLLFRVAASS